jgi:hypothetical protein
MDNDVDAEIRARISVCVVVHTSFQQAKSKWDISVHVEDPTPGPASQGAV